MFTLLHCELLKVFCGIIGSFSICSLNEQKVVFRHVLRFQHNVVSHLLRDEIWTGLTQWAKSP